MVILKKSQLQSGLDEGPGVVGGGGGGGTPLFGLSSKRLCARRLFMQGSVFREWFDHDRSYSTGHDYRTLFY